MLGICRNCVVMILYKNKVIIQFGGENIRFLYNKVYNISLKHVN
jgi:hypothetical protein